MAEDSAARRVGALLQHLSLPAPASDHGLQRQSTAAFAGRSLPRFDVGVMEAYLDDLRGMKLDVYELLRQHPELLPPVLEGMTKGADPHPPLSSGAVVCKPHMRLLHSVIDLYMPLRPYSASVHCIDCEMPVIASTGEQRELVRRILHCLLDAGYSPMKYFAQDYKKYFYLAELCSLVDLSAVRSQRRPCCRMPDCD